MFVYLMRHGEAKTEDEDPERGLTDKGFRDVSVAGADARDRGIKPGAIYHSGKKRAVQTAQILSNYVKPEKGMVEAKSLAPMDDPGIWAQRISGMREDVMLVGHLPHVAKLGGLLLGRGKGEAVADFKTGEMACLKRCDDDRWVLEWIMVPELV